MNTILFFNGTISLLISIGSLFFPSLLLRKMSQGDLPTEQVKKRYLRHQRINFTVMGVVLFWWLLGPETLDEMIYIAVLVVIFISVLVCNKRN